MGWLGWARSWESSEQWVPDVIRGCARCEIGWPPIEILSIDSVVGIVPKLTAITNAAGPSLFCSTSSCNNGRLPRSSRFGYDFNHTIHRVTSPHRPPLPPNYFN